jgi:uncharacterized membrane protein YfcA
VSLPLEPAVVAALLLLSMISSALTAAFGAGGGLLLLSVLANLLPAPAVIPVHGLVQLGSNSGRAWLARRDIECKRALTFMAGALAGAAAGALVLQRIAPVLLQLSIAGFLLWTCWGPKIRLEVSDRRALPAFGAATGLLGLFVGAVGPAVLASLRRGAPNRVALVATSAACMASVHLFKVGAYALAGFDPVPWLGLVALLIAAGLVGTSLGLRLLRRMPERRFQVLLKWVLTALAARMLWNAVVGGA